MDQQYCKGRSGMDPLWCPILFAALAVSLCSSPALADRKFGKQLCSSLFYYHFISLFSAFQTLSVVLNPPVCLGLSGSFTQTFALFAKVIVYNTLLQYLQVHAAFFLQFPKLVFVLLVQLFAQDVKLQQGKLHNLSGLMGTMLIITCIMSSDIYLKCQFQLYFAL